MGWGVFFRAGSRGGRRRSEPHAEHAAERRQQRVRLRLRLGGEQRCANQHCACIKNFATFKKNGECLEDDSFPQHASYARPHR